MCVHCAECIGDQNSNFNIRRNDLNESDKVCHNFYYKKKKNLL